MIEIEKGKYGYLYGVFYDTSKKFTKKEHNWTAIIIYASSLEDQIASLSSIEGVFLTSKLLDKNHNPICERFRMNEFARARSGKFITFDN